MLGQKMSVDAECLSKRYDGVSATLLNQEREKEMLKECSSRQDDMHWCYEFGFPYREWFSCF